MTTGPKRTARQRQADLRREQILDSALQLFAAQGFAATSTKEVAQRAGITEGLLYHYFPTKAGLLQAVAERRHRFALELLDVFGEPGVLPIARGLPEIGRRLLGLMRQEEPLIRIVVGEAQTNLELRAIMRELIEAMVAQMQGYLSHRLELGELPPDLDLDSAARGFLGAFWLFFFSSPELATSDAEAAAYAQTWATTWYQGARPAGPMPQGDT